MQPRRICYPPGLTCASSQAGSEASRRNEDMEAHRRRFPPGVSLALGAAALFGLSMPAAKPLLATIDPWLAAGLLYSGAGLGLALVCVLRTAIRSRPAEAPLRRADLPWLIAAVVVGGVLGPVLLMFGLARTDAASASLLLNLEASPPWRSLGSCSASTSIAGCFSAPAASWRARSCCLGRAASPSTQVRYSSLSPASPGASTTT